MKVKIYYKGEHQANEEIEVEEDEAKKLILRGDFVSLDKPNEKWTEKQIADWIKEKGISIKYHITNDEKKDILEKLRKNGYC